MTIKASGVSSQERDSPHVSRKELSGEKSYSSNNALSDKSLDEDVGVVAIEECEKPPSPLHKNRSALRSLSRDAFNKKGRSDWKTLSNIANPALPDSGFRSVTRPSNPLKDFKHLQENWSPSLSLKKYLFVKKDSCEKKKTKSLFDAFPKTNTDFKVFKEKIINHTKQPPEEFSRSSPSFKPEGRLLDLREVLARMSPKIEHRKQHR